MKRLIILVLIVGGLIGTTIVAAPFIAATDLAKQRIAAQLENWTGRPVTFSGEPTVKLFPFLSLTIDDAKIGDASGTGGEPLVAIEKLTSKLRLLPFLIGRVDVVEFQLFRPHLQLSVDAEGENNWRKRTGSVASEATGDRSSVANDVPNQIAETRLGRFKIIDGTVTYDNARNGQHEKFSGVSVMLSWPEIGEAISGTGEFAWRSEIVEFNGSVSRPLSLIAGDLSAVRFAIASQPVRASFAGTANSLAGVQIEGATTVTTPSVRRVARWLGARIGEGSILGTGLIEGKLNWIGPSFSFSDARIELDGNSAEGTVTIDLAGQRPRVQGTLALESFDLTAYLETFQASIAAVGPWPLVHINLPFLGIADADVRLSANRVLVGAARIGTSAASLTINDGKLAVSVGEARFHGGSLEANAKVEMSNGATTISANISLEDTAAGAVLTDLVGLSFLDGKTTTKIQLSGRGTTWGALAGRVVGTANLNISDGMLIGIELGEIAGLSGGFGVVDVAAGTGTTPFKSLTGTLKFADGMIESGDIHAEGETFAIDLGGQISLIDAGVQAIGVLTAAKEDAATEERKVIPFVIGGSWTTPYLLPDYERLIRRGAEKSQVAPPVGSASPTPRPNG